MIKIDVKNIKKVEAAFKKYGEDAENEIKSITQITAQEVENKAKGYASQKRVWDNGTLAQSIQSLADVSSKGFKWIVAALMPYSAYHEFGTGGKVDVPNGWNEMAALFKGKGIKQINIMPRPFMYPAYLDGKKIFKKNIKDSLKALNKKFNNG